MNFKANIKEAAKIEVALRLGQGRAKARTASLRDVEALAQYGEEQLDALGLAKKYRAGATAHEFPARVPNNYNYRAEGTFLTLTRGSNDWFLTEVSRGDAGSCSYGSGARRAIRLSVEQQLQYVLSHPLLYQITPLPNSAFESRALADCRTNPKLLATLKASPATVTA